MFLVVVIMVLAVSVCSLRVIFACCVCCFLGVLGVFENIFGLTFKDFLRWPNILTGVVSKHHRDPTKSAINYMLYTSSRQLQQILIFQSNYLQIL